MVLITKIKIENFRGIKKAEIDGLKQVNIFIGRNGAGKSTILEAIYLASAWCKEESDILKALDKTPNRKIDYIIYRRGLRGGWTTTRDFLWYNQNTKAPIKISLEFNINDLRKILNFAILYHDRNGLVWLDVKQSMLKTGQKEESIIEIEEIDLSKISIAIEEALAISQQIVEFPLFNYGSKSITKYEDGIARKIVFKGIDLSDQYVQKIEKLVGKEIIEYFNSLIFLDDFLARDIEKYEYLYWRKILSIRADKLLVSMLKEGLEAGVEGLTYAPVNSGYVLMVLLKNTSVRIDDLGAGSRDALIKLMPLITVKDTATLLEEPENHLHPGGLHVFMKYLLKIAKENKLQLFISTHSIELVYFAYKLSEEIGIDTRVFFLEKDEDGTVSYRILEKIDVDTLRKLGLDPRFLDII